MTLRQAQRDRICPGITAASAAAASLADERRIGTRLDLLPLAAQAGLGSGPAILLIGAATRMDPESAAADRFAAAQAA